MPSLPKTQLSELEKVEEDVSQLPEHLPIWLLAANSNVLAALSESMQQSLHFKQRLHAALSPLQGIEVFASPLLVQAVREKLGLAVDVNMDVFAHTRYMSQPSTLLSLPRQGALEVVSRHSLLQAALQNFEEHEATNNGLSRCAKLELGVGNEASDVTPEQFATVCRELDLGAQYQAHLDKVFTSSISSGEKEEDSTRSLYKNSQRHEMAVAAHIAFMKGDIGEQAYRMVVDVSSLRPASYGSDFAVFQCQLSMFGVTLTGIVVFEVALILPFSSSTGEPYNLPRRQIVYIPNDPASCFKEYPTAESFAEDMGERLTAADYQQFFVRFVPQRESLKFTETLRRRVDGAQMSGGGSQPNLSIALSLIHGGLFDHLFTAQLARIKDDAKVLAVPTADEDEKSRIERLHAYETAGIVLLNVAALFVPVLGEILLGVMAVQLSEEVFEGIEDWREGDRQEALSHLTNVVENLALAAAIGAGGKAASHLLKRSGFVEGLVPVNVGDGRVRLWNPDLAEYEVDTSLVLGAEADAQGLSKWGDQHVVQVDGQSYITEFDTLSQTWRIRHPRLNGKYAPRIEHNGNGGWRHEGETPLQWQERLYLLRRIGTPVAEFTDQTLEQILTVTNVDEALLRRVHLDNIPLPGAVLDTLARFRFDQAINQFIEHMTTGKSLATVDPDLQIFTLSRLPTWPSSTSVRIVEEAGRLVDSYHPASGVGARFVRVTQVQIKQGRLLEAIWSQLDRPQQLSLIGDFPVVTQVPVEQLVRKIADYARDNRPALFEHSYERYAKTSEVAEATIQIDFPGIPTAVARDMVAAASDVEREQLTTQWTVPLRLAEEARWRLREVRQQRAYEGLYLQSVTSHGTDKLAMQLLGRLSGWPIDLALELRADSTSGLLLGTLGEFGTTTGQIIVHSASGYQVYAATGERSGASSNDLFSCLFQVLSPSQRSALGLSETQAGQALRANLAQLAASQRNQAAELLGQRPIGFKPPERLVDGRIGYVLSGRGAGARGSSINEIRALYPGMSESEARNYIEPLRRAGVDVTLRVKFLRAELNALDETLLAWKKAALAEPGHSALSAQRLRESREQAAEIIRRCWRKLTPRQPAYGNVPGYTLDLEGLKVGKLPTLPTAVDFDHVVDLRLNNMHLTDESFSFLRHFVGLRRLDLSSNALATLPEAIGTMPSLSQLSLEGNQIALTTRSAAMLRDCLQLQVLNFNGNPVGSLLDLERMTGLREVRLRNTGLNAWPEGLLCRFHGYRLDLRDNQITTVPETVLNAPPWVNSAVALQHNPLTAQTLEQLEQYRQRTGIRLAISHTHVVSAPRVRELWVEGDSTEEVMRRRAQWQALVGTPASDELFRLLADLSETADFRSVRRDLQRRVWGVLEAAHDNTTLREELFDLAANPRSCGDSVALNFGVLEVAVLVHRAKALAVDEQVTEQLLRLARRLFRSEQLDEVVRRVVMARATTPGALPVDEIEVNLAYRVGLADALDLPDKPQSMLYSSLAAVEPEQLEEAQRLVLRAEQSPALLKFVSERGFWIDYLKAHHEQQFTALDESYRVQMEVLMDIQKTLTDEVYRQRMNTVALERNAAEQALVKQLTEELWTQYGDVPTSE